MNGSHRGRRDLVATAIALVAIAVSLFVAAPAYASTAGSIQGRALLASGAPYPDAYVTVYTTSGNGAGSIVSTQGDGTFSVPDLPAGSYRLQLQASNGNADAVTPYWFGGASIGTGPVYTVSAGQVRDLGTFTVPDGAVISGSISTDSSDPVLGSPAVDLIGPDGTTSYSTVGGMGRVVNNDEAGATYEINGVRTGSYRVEFRDGRADLKPQYWNTQSTLAAATSISLTAGHTTTGINGLLHARPQLRGTVNGTAPNGTVSALSGAVVNVWDASGGEFLTSATADFNGHYSIPLEPGGYKIQFNGNSSNSPKVAPQWYGGTRFAETSSLVTVSTADVTGIDATLASPSSISGHIQRASGGSLSGLIVWALGQAPSGARTTLSGGWVGSDGSYTIDYLPAGDVILQIQDTVTTGRPSTYFPNAGTPAGAQVIPVGAVQALTGYDATIGTPLAYPAGAVLQVSGTSTRYLSDGNGGLITLPNTAIDADFGFNQGTSFIASVPPSTTIYGPLTPVVACGAGALWVAGDGEITELRMAGGAFTGWPTLAVPDALCNALPHGTWYQNGYPPLNMPQQVFLKARDTGIVYWAYQGSVRQIATSQISSIDSYSPSRIIPMDGSYIRARPLNPTLGSPQLFTAPVVFGASAVGSTWTVDTGGWASGVTGEPTVAPFWLRCSSPITHAWTTVPAGCTAIAGAHSTSYVSTAADAGKYLTAQVAASNALGFTLAGALTNVATDGPVAPANTAAPTVSGSATVGSTWTVSTGTWTGTPTPTVAPFWLRCNSPITSAWTTVPAGCTAISGAHATTYVSTSADAGKYLTAQVAATNSAGWSLAGALTTVATDGPVAPANTAAPTVSGSATVGSTWTVSTGTWSGTPAPTTAPFWLRCNAPITTAWTTVPAGCTAISGAHATTYVSTAADAGKYLTAQVAATNTAGWSLAGALTTVATDGPVATVAPANTAVPTVTGSATVGSTWTVSTGTWSGTPAPTLAPFWLRCNSPLTTAWTTVPAGCTAISGARSTTYVSTAADAGKYLTAQVAATNSAGWSLAGALTTLATG